MLTTNPEFSTFMPCTLAVYEAGDKTVLSTMNMGIMLKLLNRMKNCIIRHQTCSKHLPK